MKFDYDQISKTRVNLSRIASTLKKVGCPDMQLGEARLGKNGAGAGEFYQDGVPVSGWSAEQVIEYALRVEEHAGTALRKRDALAEMSKTAHDISIAVLDQITDSENK